MLLGLLVLVGVLALAVVVPVWGWRLWGGNRCCGALPTPFQCELARAA